MKKLIFLLLGKFKFPPAKNYNLRNLSSEINLKYSIKLLSKSNDKNLLPYFPGFIFKFPDLYPPKNFRFSSIA